MEPPLDHPQDGMAVAEARIAEEAERRTGTLDLRNLGLPALPESLFVLRHLRVLDLGCDRPWDKTTVNRIDAQRERLRCLSQLQTLFVQGTDLTSGGIFAHFQHLEALDCSSTQISDLSPLAGLANLQQLNCFNTQVNDLSPLAGLANLQQLDCSDTQVSDLSPLAGLANLQQLNCSGTQVSDLSPLAGLANLQQLTCSYTRISDLSPLAGLANLQQLDCSGTPVSDLSPLAGLANLQQLDCSGTPVSNLSPLAGLANLQQLTCSRTRISDLSPLAGLANLQQLNCYSTQVSDLSPLAGLANLQQLTCSSTQVSDLSPLTGLTALWRLNGSRCRLASPLDSLLNLPSLQRLVLFESHAPGIPAVGVLSQVHGENCLDRVRAHFADLAAGVEVMPNVKLLLLGNGCAGKTQIARWLAGEPFDPHWNSTHGIQVGGGVLPGDRPVTLHIWDFGGQDIYHGTHALFLRSPAVLAVVWARDTEELEAHEHSGLPFRNFPLPYWIDLVRQQGHPDSPVLMVQSKCDRPEQEVLPFPIPAEALEPLPYRKQLHVSVREGRGRAALEEALRDSVNWLCAPERMGLAQIGAGRLRVQRRLEALRDADGALPPEQRRHRLLSRTEFDAICAEEGGISSIPALLAYLDANGVVFHRPGLFEDRVVLDQGWALEAIYAVFDRSAPLKEIRRLEGRFTRAQLGRLVWQDHSVGEQKLFISMMRSCGICFLHRKFSGEDDAEYIAPELLPERAAVADRIAGRWDDDRAEETAVYRYALLHGGLIRAIMAEVGEVARADALYWQTGLYAAETTTGSRLLIEQVMTGPWQGEIRVRTQRGRAADLLDRAVKLVERVQDRLGMRPLAVERSAPAVQKAEERPMAFAQEKPAQPEWYVSYAWGDATPEGSQREKVVDDLCAAAEARGRIIQRDKKVLGLGDSISAFMRRIAAGDRVFVVLSDKYLRSPFCMFELSEIWRTSRQHGPDFLGRVRAYALPDAKIWDSTDWVDWAIHWKEEYEKLDSRARQHGAGILGEHGHARLRQMQVFYTQVSDILGTLADVVQPRTFDELTRHGFDDRT